MRKGQELGWSSLAYIMLFIIGALVLLTFVFRFLPTMQGAFSDTICKMNAWMRASTIGSPLMQSMLSIGGFFSGGFAGLSSSSLNLPLACEPGPAIGKDKTVGLKDILEKIGMESIRCWDDFGQGMWDPLVLYSGGQTFKCYEEILNISCTEDDARKLLFDPNPSNALLNSIPSETNPLGSEFIRYYFKTRQSGYSGFNKTYADMLPQDYPVYETNLDNSFYCTGQPKKYLIGLYFVDTFSGTLRGASVAPLICDQIALTGSDKIVLCTVDVTGMEVE